MNWSRLSYPSVKVNAKKIKKDEGVKAEVTDFLLLHIILFLLPNTPARSICDNLTTEAMCRLRVFL